MVKLNKSWVFIALFCLLLSCGGNNDEMQLNEIEGGHMGVKTFSFRAEDNPGAILEEVECKIIGDSVIDCWIPYILEDKCLIAHFDCRGGNL